MKTNLAKRQCGPQTQPAGLPSGVALPFLGDASSLPAFLALPSDSAPPPPPAFQAAPGWVRVPSPGLHHT